MCASNTLPFRIVIVCGWFLSAAITGSMIGCDAKGASGNQAARLPMEAVPVRVAVAKQENIPRALRAIGTVEPYQTVTVRPRIEGQLTEIHFTEGQFVEAGELLCTIDPRPYEAALRLVEAQLAKNEAMRVDAEREAKRIVGLFEQGNAAEREFNSTQALAQATAAQVKADEAAVQKAKLDLEYCSIRSPLSGRVGAKLADAGNVVKANETPLVIINQIQPIFVSFSLAERHLAVVRDHMRGGKLAVTASVPTSHEKDGGGELTFLNNEVDRTTGMFRAKSVFANMERKLWPGQFVNVELILAQRPDAIVVPAQALQTSQDGTVVFIVKPDNTVEMRDIRVAETVDGRTVVESGVAVGETVVTDGQLRLNDGAHVEIKNTTTQTAGTGK